MRFSNPSRVLSNSLPLLPLNLRQHPQKEGANAGGFCGLIGARRPHCGGLPLHERKAVLKKTIAETAIAERA
jgi:hypothetical protein